MAKKHSLQKIRKFLVLSFSFALFVFRFTFVYALNIDKVKINFLNGDYKVAILEGEKLLANSKNAQGLDELYYFLGLSYLKDGNYLRASDICEIILNEFKNSRFSEGAKRLNQVALENSSTIAQSNYYTVQVGSFANSANARSLLQKLTQNGYPAFLEESGEGSDKMYRVKAGKLPTREEALKLQDKLAQEGYPTKICP